MISYKKTDRRVLWMDRLMDRQVLRTYKQVLRAGKRVLQVQRVVREVLRVADEQCKYFE